MSEQVEKSRIVDDWTSPSEAHKLMPSSWVGRIIFQVDSNEDATLGGDCRRQRERLQQAEKLAAQIKPELVWADAFDSD